jgi:hypothetical protein
MGKKHWEKVLSAQTQSGLTVAAFCKKENIGVASFYQWKRRLGAAACPSSIPATGAFLELGSLDDTVTRSQTNTRPWMVTLDFGEGLRLTLQRS